MFFLIKEGITNLKRTPFASFSAIFVIYFAMLAVNTIFFIKVNIDKFWDDYKSEVTIEAFLLDSAEDSQIEELITNLQSLPDIQSVEFISKEQALEIFKSEFSEDPMETIGYNPLPRSLVVIPTKENLDENKISKVVSILNSYEIIDEVSYENFIGKIKNLGETGKNIALAVLAGLAFLGILLVYNTIRLAINEKREIIRTMRLVGATRFTIRFPFLITGIIQGALAGIAAYFTFKYFIIFAEMTIIPDSMFSKIDLTQDMSLYIILSAVITGFLGSYIASGRFIPRY